MNLYNNEDENKGGAPVIRGGAPFKKTSLFGRTPMLSRAAGGIMERLKNLSRKDMAFVGVGLSVLVMAPVAEYVMSKPSADNLLAPGFGSREGSAISSLYEPGINALSQGSADGSGEVITPLSSRDPASLILGAQPAQAPVMAAPPPDMSSMRDAMKDSGRAAFSAAAQSAGAPTVIPRMQAGLRGFSAGGGEGGSRTSGALSGKAIIDEAKSASNKAAKRSMVGPVAMPGYKGVASNTPNSASKSALEKLRSQADKSAGNFTGGSAMGSLDRAAADAVFAGKGDGGNGAGSDGTAAKSASGNTNKNSHSSSGESLEQLAAKQRQAKALEWEFFLQYDIKKQFYKAGLDAISTSMGKMLGRWTDKIMGNGEDTPTYVCLTVKNPDAKPVPISGICDFGGTLANSTEKKRSSDTKTIDSWAKDDFKGCPCGVVRLDEYLAKGGGSDGSDGDGATKPPTEAEIVNTLGVIARDTFKEYDTALGLMMGSIKAGKNADESKELMTHTKALAAGFASLGVDQLTTKINNNSEEALSSGGVGLYADSINESSGKIKEVKTKADPFDKKLDAIVANPAQYITAQNGAVVVVDESLKGELAQMSRTFKQKMTLIPLAEAKIKLHESRLAVYRDQIKLVKKGADAVLLDYGKVLAQAKTINDELAKMPPAPTTLADVQLLKAHFKTLSGLDAELSDPKAAATTRLDPDALAYNDSGIKDFRDQLNAVKPLNPKLIFNAMTWRGIPDTETEKVKTDDLIKNSFKKDKVNDVEAIKAERESWKKATPLIKNPVPESLDNLASKSLLAEDMRNASVAADARGSLLDPSLEAAALSSIETAISSITTRLAAMNINIDKPTGGVTENPVNTNVPLTDAISEADRTVAVDAAKGDLATAMGLATAKDKEVQDLIAKTEKLKPEMDGYKAESTKALAAIKESQGLVNGYITDMAACKTNACVSALKVKIKAEMDKIAAAQAQIQALYDKAKAISTLNPDPVTGQTPAQIKAAGIKAHARIDAAYKAGQPKWTGFPKGDNKGLNDLRAIATTQWGKIKAAYTGSDALRATTNAASEATRPAAEKALKTLNDRAYSAEAALTKLKKAYNDALAYKPPKPVIPEPPSCSNNESCLNSIELVQTKNTVPVYAYDADGNVVWQQRCKVPESHWFSEDTCKNNDYYPREKKVVGRAKGWILRYNPSATIDSVSLDRLNKDMENGTAKYGTNPMKLITIDEYEMEAAVLCKYDVTAKKWLVTRLQLRKGKNASATAFGASLTVGGGAVVKVEGTVSVEQSYSHFRYGVFEDQALPTGLVCK